jgi:hypothetical protein
VNRPRIERVLCAVYSLSDTGPRIERILCAVYSRYGVRPRIECVLCAVYSWSGVRPRIECVLCAVYSRSGVRPRIERVLCAVRFSIYLPQGMKWRMNVILFKRDPLTMKCASEYVRIWVLFEAIAGWPSLSGQFLESSS